jgi:hypothetical protein
MINLKIDLVVFKTEWLKTEKPIELKLQLVIVVRPILMRIPGLKNS